MDSDKLGDRFVPAKRVIVVIDLTNFARAFQERSDAQLAAFLDSYYALCEEKLAAPGVGGRIVKFMGDACLAVFPAELAGAAVSAVVHLQHDLDALTREQALPFAMGANIHMAELVEAELGGGSSRRADVIGRGVNQAFLLGRGAGVRISEPVYRSLASGERSPWTKHKPPAVYSLANPGEVYGGLGKDAATNAQRW
ncbi:MAG TPA: adenylate/guanylate cyclase domain-containing protein [Polyangiaceae bacterium]|jgi:class 3 adenylate cyclase|nr:adenylate/guanylate cyclase domain-containing protein [Polyangiaceae bacterium]